MRVLVACEFSGVVREAFRAAGHDAWSCDLLPTDIPSEYHYQGDIFELLEKTQWDLMIAHPPCTYLCSSGLHWNKRVEGRADATEAALIFVKRLLEVDVPKICLENPIGCISSRIRKPDQIIQPHQFGHDASKATCLWLKGLPKLQGTLDVAPRIVADGRYKGKKRWANQTDSGQNRLGPSDTRWAERSITYQGVADAFAEQYG